MMKMTRVKTKKKIVQVEWIILNKVNLTINSAGSNRTTRQILLDMRRSSKRSRKLLHKPKFLDQVNSQGYFNARNVVTNVATSLTKHVTQIH